MTPFLGALLWAALKVTVLLGASTLIAGLLRSRSAALRHQVLVAAVIGALLLPIGHLAGVRWIVSAPFDRGAALIAPLSRAAAKIVPSHVGPATSSERKNADVHLIGWQALAVLSWLAGSLTLLAMLGWNLHRFRSMARDGCELTTDGYAPSGTRVILSQTCSVPCTAGLWRPMILLPAASANWSPAELRAALEHERAHSSRRDPIFHALAEVLSALYWWNPLVWLTAGRLRLEAERAADDVVLSAGVSARDYAAQLLRLGGVCARRPAPAPARHTDGYHRALGTNPIAGRREYGPLGPDCARAHAGNVRSRLPGARARGGAHRGTRRSGLHPGAGAFPARDPGPLARGRK
jgi:beta-lactamase regulating signal transducer with metallopeptidase domain